MLLFFKGFDFVRLYDGPTPDDPVTAELHGTAMPSPEEGHEPYVLVQLVSDSSVEGDGFFANFECVEPGTAPPPPLDPCLAPLAVEGDSGQIAKEGGYGHSHDCQWMITCSESDDIIELSFTSFDLEGGFDFVNLFDGPTADGSSFVELSGTEVPPIQRSSTSSMTVQLTSDGSVAGDGFVANFQCTL
jgi:hypothetical protein